MPQHDSGWPAQNRVLDPAVIVVAARTLRLLADALEAAGARRRLRHDFADLREAYDYIANFQYGAVRALPMQVEEELLTFLSRFAVEPPRRVLELGTGQGGTLFVLCQAAAADATIVSIDMKAGAFGGGYPGAHAHLLKAFARPDQRLHLLRRDSHAPQTHRAVSSIFTGRIDMLFIDGDHSYAGVRRDYEMYAPLVKPGGVVAFHDIVAGQPWEVGGVPAFWGEVRTRTESTEIISEREHGGFGIGVIRKRDPDRPVPSP